MPRRPFLTASHALYYYTKIVWLNIHFTLFHKILMLFYLPVYCVSPWPAVFPIQHSCIPCSKTFWESQNIFETDTMNRHFWRSNSMSGFSLLCNPLHRCYLTCFLSWVSRIPLLSLKPAISFITWRKQIEQFVCNYTFLTKGNEFIIGSSRLFTVNYFFLFTLRWVHHSMNVLMQK